MTEKFDDLRAAARDLRKTMRCNCDLDRWQPEPSTGHSHVCRIHREVIKMVSHPRGVK